VDRVGAGEKNVMEEVLLKFTGVPVAEEKFPTCPKAATEPGVMLVLSMSKL
jgi:hypothetical protein